MKPNKILGIDPGMHTGWALIDGKELSLAGSFDLGSMQKNYLHRLMLHLMDRITALRPDLVCHEDPIGMHGIAYASIQRQIGVIQLACDWLQIPYVFVNQSTVKAFAKKASGLEGPMDKTAMLLTAKAAGGNGIGTHDQADAYWIARWAHAQTFSEGMLYSR
jgi:Holliday junction resolvasome RuvABC endonuclease subunit